MGIIAKKFETTCVHHLSNVSLQPSSRYQYVLIAFLLVLVFKRYSVSLQISLFNFAYYSHWNYFRWQLTTCKITVSPKKQQQDKTWLFEVAIKQQSLLTYLGSCSSCSDEKSPMVPKAQFIRRASAVPNLMNIGFDVSTAEARLQFRRRARVELNSVFAQ